MAPPPSLLSARLDEVSHKNGERGIPTFGLSPAGLVLQRNVKTSGRQIKGRSLETEAYLARNRNLALMTRREDAIRNRIRQHFKRIAANTARQIADKLTVGQ